MNTLIHADIFFFISTIAIVIITIVLCVVGGYTILIMRDAKHISKKLRHVHSDIDTVERVEILRDLRLGVFDVLVGGMGSIMGSILTGLGLGLVEGLTKVFYPQASSTVVFAIMVIVLLFRPAGLFGREK